MRTGSRPLIATALLVTLPLLVACGEEQTASPSEAVPSEAAQAVTPAAATPSAAAEPEAEVTAQPAEPRIVEATGQPIPETFMLSNGMQVVVIEDRRAPVVTHMVWYKVGSADEPRGKSGIAHYLEHLLFKGTEKVPTGEFSATVARNGGQENAFTSYDYTGYFQRVARDRLPLVMELEADRMTGLVLTEELVLPERDVILEERSARVENDPGSLLSEQMNAMLYLAHPYGTPIIGWEHEMRGLTYQDALDFYRTWYDPANAVLIVAGDVDAAELRPLAEQFYGVVPSNGGQPDRVRPQDPPQRAARRVVLEDARVEQPYVRRAYLAPSYANGEPGEAEALDVLSEIIGGGATARIYKSLVVDQKIALGASGWYIGSSLDDGSIGFFAVPAPGVAMADAEAAIDAEIDKLLADGVTAEEVERAQRTLVADAIFAQDSQQSMARSYGVALMTGLTVEHAATWPDRVLAVTPEQVTQAARKYLRKERSVTGVLTRPQTVSDNTAEPFTKPDTNTTEKEDKS
ncbi:pitrilysin family protein [Pyruvatibacter sp.]|uniref:M16 family metallopeptidase n=1 Tax=Pyruvatibacter sp. TaxID=1981328 RepID=UPI00326613BA